MADFEQDSGHYEAQDTIHKATQSFLVTGSAGFLLSAVQNTMSRQNVGAFGVLTKFGGTTLTFATMGGAYGFASAVSANLREKKDPWSEATGGFFGGATVGLRSRTMSGILGSGMVMAVGLGILAYSADAFQKQTAEEADEARQAKKDEVRKRFRRPVNELVNEIGEGRGIYPPGYEERRRERIKERYGIEIQEPYYKGQSANE